MTSHQPETALKWRLVLRTPQPGFIREEAMTTAPVSLERRAGQRFDYQTSVSVKLPGTSREACGFTQDLSARGTFFYTDLLLVCGESVELTFLMPSEITLTESMKVRCRGTVLRVVPPTAGTTMGVAVHFVGYEYISQPAEVSAGFSRISALHGKASEEDQPADSPDGRSSVII